MMLKITYISNPKNQIVAVYGSDEHILAVAKAHKKTQALMWTILTEPITWCDLSLVV